MKHIEDIAARAFARLAGASDEEIDELANADEPNRVHRRAFIESQLPRSMRRALGFGQWRRHRYLTRK